MLLQRFDLIKIFLMAVLASGLSACGGGDDGGSGGSPASGITLTIPGAPVAIVEANADAVAGETFDSVSNGAGAVPPVLLSASSNGSQPQAWSPFQAAGFGVQRFGAGNTAGSGPITNQVQQCQGGGQVDVVDNGTSGSLTFSNCVDNGAVINGVVLVSNIVDTPTQSNVTLVFQGFTMSMNSGTDYVAIQGDISLSISTSTGVTTSTVSGSDFASQFNNEAFRLTNYNLTNVFDPGPPSTDTNTANFTYASTGLGGQVTVQTLMPFVTNGGDQYPSSGQALATGSNGSKCRLTVIDNVNVTLDVDADGDGVYETNINTTWAAIDAAG